VFFGSLPVIMRHSSDSKAGYEIFKGIVPISSSHFSSIRERIPSACFGLVREETMAQRLPREKNLKSIWAGCTFPVPV
jgi:hypothetical protein